MIRKEDIKPGMGVVLRNGAEGIIIPCVDHPKAIILIDHEGTQDGWMDLDGYDEGLHSEGDEGDYSIDKVYSLCKYPRRARKRNFDDGRKLLWGRADEVKEITMAEVEEKFGCKVKIVREEF